MRRSRARSARSAGPPGGIVPTCRGAARPVGRRRAGRRAAPRCRRATSGPRRPAEPAGTGCPTPGGRGAARARPCAVRRGRPETGSRCPRVLLWPRARRAAPRLARAGRSRASTPNSSRRALAASWRRRPARETCRLASSTSSRRRLNRSASSAKRWNPARAGSNRPAACRSRDELPASRAGASSLIQLSRVSGIAAAPGGSVWPAPMNSTVPTPVPVAQTRPLSAATTQPDPASTFSPRPSSFSGCGGSSTSRATAAENGGDPRIHLPGDVDARAAFDQRARPHAAQGRARQRPGHGDQRHFAGRLLARRFLTHRFSVGRLSAGRLFAVRHLAVRHLAGRFSAGCFSAGRFPDAEHQAPRPRPQQVLEARHHDAVAALHQEDVDAAPFDEPRRGPRRRGGGARRHPTARRATRRARRAVGARTASSGHRSRAPHPARTALSGHRPRASRPARRASSGHRSRASWVFNRRARAGGTGRPGRRTGRRGCPAAPPRRHRARRSDRSCGWC